jgi:hypothetical protein
VSHLGCGDQAHHDSTPDRRAACPSLDHGLDAGAIKTPRNSFIMNFQLSKIDGIGVGRVVIVKE